MTNNPLNYAQRAALRRLLDQHTDQPACLLALAGPALAPARIGSHAHFILVEPLGSLVGDLALVKLETPHHADGAARLTRAEVAELRDYLTQLLDS